MPIYQATGRTVSSSSAVWATQQPYTTQQIAVDLTEVLSMRAVVGHTVSLSAAIIVS